VSWCVYEAHHRQREKEESKTMMKQRERKEPRKDEKESRNLVWR
jgi:hypothetical protein